MMNRTCRHFGLPVAIASALALSACDEARAGNPGEGEVAGALQGGEGRLIVDIELGNGNRYEIWVDQDHEGKLAFVVLESGPVGNPSLDAVALDRHNLSELFHAIASADREFPAELLAEFGEPRIGERGWLAERWKDPPYRTAVTCDDTWWVNTICNAWSASNHQTWLNWGVSTNETSWHWNTYNQTRYYVAVCNQGPNNVKKRVRFKDEQGDPTSQYEIIAVPGTWYYWARVQTDGVYNVHSYAFATSGTAVVDMCVARTPE